MKDKKEKDENKERKKADTKDEGKMKVNNKQWIWSIIHKLI